MIFNKIFKNVYLNRFGFSDNFHIMIFILSGSVKIEEYKIDKDFGLW